MARKIATFDIFDTCLIRSCGRPADFFDVFSFNAFSEEVDDNIRISFLLSRLSADENLNKEDKSIEDIYDNLDFSHEKLFSKDVLIEKEQALERDVLVPARSIQTKICEMRKQGYQVVFVSDMYLHTEFLKSVLQGCGLFTEGDAIYVSCDVGLTKSSGKLFDYVAQVEEASFENWIHFGDNPYSDIAVPSSKGIKTKQVTYDYSPYQQKWLSSEYHPKFRYHSLLAGVGRSVLHSVPNTSHTLFAVDIVAPLMVPFVYNVFHDASKKGLTDLYFLSRDALSAYQIACGMSSFFKDIRPHYLYVSQDALYSDDNEVKLKYFEQEGLASTVQRNAIVDIRSTGKSIEYINEFLSGFNKYNPVSGYYLDIFCNGEKTHDRNDYYSELNGAYNKYSPNGKLLNALEHWNVIEMFFSPQDSLRTVGYTCSQDGIKPVFSPEKTTKDCVIDDAQTLNEHQNMILKQYVESFMKLQLYRCSHEIVNTIAIPTICEFFRYPYKPYLGSLASFKVWNHNIQCFSPYVEKKNLLSFFFPRTTKKLVWSTGSLVFSSPSFLPSKAVLLLFDKFLR